MRFKVHLAPSFLPKGKKEGSLFYDLPHRSHSRGASPSQVYGSLRSLLCGVSRHKNDTQSFLLVRRLFALSALRSNSQPRRPWSTKSQSQPKEKTQDTRKGNLSSYGCGDGIFLVRFGSVVQICFGLFAIRRSDTTNDAMSDPDVCGALVDGELKCLFWVIVR